MKTTHSIVGDLKVMEHSEKAPANFNYKTCAMRLAEALEKAIPMILVEKEKSLAANLWCREFLTEEPKHPCETQEFNKQLDTFLNKVREGRFLPDQYQRHTQKEAKDDLVKWINNNFVAKNKTLMAGAK